MKKKLIILTIVYFIFGISINLIHPITTNYVRSLNLNDVYFGIFFSLMSLGIFLGALFWGKLSDKVGRTKILCLGILGYAVFQFCFGFFNEIPVLILLFRVLSGVFVSAPHTLFLSFVRDIEKEENLGKSYSFMSSFHLLGAALGYKIGGYLYSEANLSFNNVFLVQVLSLVALAIVFYLCFNKENDNKIEIKNKYSSLLNLKNQNKSIIIFFISLLFITLSQTIITKYIDVFVIDLKYDTNNLGDMVLLTGIIGIISNLIFTKVLNKYKNLNYNLLYIIAIFISVISLFVTFTFNQDNFVIMMYTTYSIFIVCKSIMLPLEQSIIARNTSGNSGEVMGLRQSFVALGQVIGPLIASNMYPLNHYSVFYFSIIIYGVIGIILLMNYKVKKGV